MTNNSEDRLSRIEKLIESNAKSIEALSEDRRESERDKPKAWCYAHRARFYQEMANLSNSMANLSTSIANLSNAQADFYRRMENFSRRQGDIVEILKLLQQREN